MTIQFYSVKYTNNIFFVSSEIRSLAVLCRALQEHAFESSQKYKEGKFIIELAHMIKDNGWD